MIKRRELSVDALDAVNQAVEAAIERAKQGAQPKQVELAEVVRHGDAFIVPEGMNIPQQIATLQRLDRMEEEVYTFVHTFETFTFDGAYALDKAIKKVFGFSFGEVTRSFFGDKPPQLVEIQTGPNAGDHVSVPWGRFSLPNVSGELFTSGGVENGKFVFKLIANVKRKHEKQLKALADEVRAQLAAESLYRGKAFKLNFESDKTDPWTGETIPNTPEFLQLAEITEEELILNRDITDILATNLFAPIDRLEDMRALGMSGKRGVLLSGTYGTGKTLAATVTANKAQKAGVTFLLCENAAQFADAVAFAKLYAPAVVFCEDIDRTLQGNRTADMDQILNVVDGIESKATEVMVVVTTNDVNSINPAALRPGRFDVVVNMEPPDVEATERLIRLYAGTSITPDTDVHIAAETLTGNIPAVIAEAVNRAKLAQVRRNAPGDTKIIITPQAMLEAAKSMALQMDLLNRPRPVSHSQLEKGLALMGQVIAQSFNGPTDTTLVGRNRLLQEELAKLPEITTPARLNGKAE